MARKMSEKQMAAKGIAWIPDDGIPVYKNYQTAWQNIHRREDGTRITRWMCEYSWRTFTEVRQ